MCVPLLSPRETNGACAAWIFFSASRMSLPPAIFAGSLFGPISTKSLYITGKRLTPWPSARNFSSAAFAWTNDDVGVAAAREVERLTGAERHDAHLDAGLLLEDGQDVAEQARLLGRRRRGNGDETFLRVRGERDERAEQCKKCTTGDHHGSSPSRNLRRLGRGGVLQKTIGRRAFHEPALVQEQDLVAQAMRLAEVVRHHHDLGAGGVQRDDHLLDLVGRARIEARRGLVEEQNFRAQRPHARQRQRAAARRRKARAPRGSRMRVEADLAQRFQRALLALPECGTPASFSA